MTRFLSLCLLNALSCTTRAARMIKRAASRRERHATNKTGAFSDVYTTVKGCTCKSPCQAYFGTGFRCDTCTTEDRCGSFSFRGFWDYCDYGPSTVQAFIDRSAQSKMQYYWSNIVANTTRYPNYPLLQNVLSSIRTSFDNYRPEMPATREKLIHTVGSVCQFKLDISTSSPYTGLLAPGLKNGLIRMGGATEPSGGLTPGLGFKFPRSGVYDGDFVGLYSLAFGDSWNFFGRNQSNHIAPAEGFTKVLAKKFEEASQCPTQIGISDLARYAQDGSESSPPKFPFKVFLVAGSDVRTGLGEKTVDGIHAELDSIPVGSTLYTLYACQVAAGDELEPTESLEASCGQPLLLGAMETTSRCTTSYYGDSKLHIRHQRIEEDWLLEPGYLKMSSEMGAYDARVACGRGVTAEGAPPKCGATEAGMLNSDA